MKKAAEYWRILLSVVSLTGAIACFYRAVELGVTAEEGLKYTPVVSLHPTWRHLQVIADRWAGGAATLLLFAFFFAAWHLYMYISNRRVLAQLHDGV